MRFSFFEVDSGNVKDFSDVEKMALFTKLHTHASGWQVKSYHADLTYNF
jgi:hypothetical protein